MINEDFDLALSQLVAIVTATRLRYSTQMARIGRYLGNLGSDSADPTAPVCCGRLKYGHIPRRYRHGSHHR